MNMVLLEWHPMRCFLSLSRFSLPDAPLLEDNRGELTIDRPHEGVWRRLYYATVTTRCFDILLIWRVARQITENKNKNLKYKDILKDSPVPSGTHWDHETMPQHVRYLQQPSLVVAKPLRIFFCRIGQGFEWMEKEGKGVQSFSQNSPS